MGLTKTVYNPAALKAAQKTSEETLKKKQVRGEMEGMVVRGVRFRIKATIGKRNGKVATLILILRTEGST